MTKGELILFGVSEIIYVYCIFAFFELFLEKRPIHKNIFYLITFIVWGLEMLLSLENFPSIVVFFANLFIEVSIAWFLFKGNWKRKLVSVLFLDSFLITMDVFSFLIFNKTKISLEYIFFIQTLWLLTWTNLVKKYLDTNWKFLPWRYLSVFVTIPFISVIGITFVFIFINEKPDFYETFPFLFIIVYINMTVLFLYEGIGKYIEETRQKDRIKNQRDGLEKVLEEKNRSEMEIRKFRHEYINDLTKLQYLLEEGDCDLAWEAIGSHLNNLKRTSKKIWLGDPLLDYLLEEKRQAFLDLGTELIWDVEPIGKRESINFSLYTILENLLKNALEALEGAENKYLSLEISKNQGLEIKIENSFKEKPLTRRGRFYRRDKKVGRGLGLVITQEEVQKLKGKMDISVDDNLFTVFIKIPC
ncbi:sensor histidine kinase [Urinicoccus timonensis]|uniref:sensor histidine kinase n=1 Tax=Urinicoccus timonensis TaxID=2024205 RepID=UPI000C079BAA|nr:GHKL domain-containing protein [Urinicoccus timonensis]